MNYSNLGYLAFYILLIQIMPFLINYINRNYVKTKSKKYFALMKKFRLVHRILGATLIIIPLVHWQMALGVLVFHTGTILYSLVFLTIIMGMAFNIVKKREILKAHRALGLSSFFFFFIHYFFPNII